MKKIILKTILLSAICFSVFALAGSVSAATYNVSIFDNYFNPANLQINPGDTVIWTNNGQNPHTVTSDSGTELNSGTLYANNTYSHTFYTTGTFAYHCAIHPSMQGTITVAATQQAGTQTYAATNVSYNSATLNGYVSNPTSGSVAYVWFQWGTSASYGNETYHQPQSTAGSFSQNISNLSPNTTYHFRAVAQSTYGNIAYGQNMTFYTTGSGTGGYLLVGKKVINLTSGNLNWQASVNANPGDILSFVIVLQAGGQDVHNIVIRDNLPQNLIYRGNLTLNASLNNSANPMSGINAGTISAGQVYVVSYQAQAAPEANFAYGTTTLSNSATVISTEIGAQTANAQVIVNKSAVSGATYVPAGITNNPIKDSFFFPVALIILGSWLYFSGRIYKFSDWLGEKI